MRIFIALTTSIFIFSIASLMYPPETYAYIDPGTGSYFFQIVIAFFLGFAFTLKVFWGRLIAFFRKLFSSNK